MQLHSTFKTYNGYCHIFLDKLVISKSPAVDGLAISSSHKSAKQIFRIILYSIILIVLTVTGVRAIYFEIYYWAAICFVFGFIALNYLFRLFTFSEDNIIERAAITNIAYYSSVYGVQQAHFVITFTTARRFSNKKSIYLTQNYAPDTDENIQAALNIMNEEFG